jgi:hypothetical protein
MYVPPQLSDAVIVGAEVPRTPVAAQTMMSPELMVPVGVQVRLVPGASQAFPIPSLIGGGAPELPVTVKLTPLDSTPDTVTTTFPVVAPLGTDVLMLVAVHPVTVAAVPLNVTVLPPCVDPKFVPVIVTGVPTGPLLTLKLEIAGDGLTPFTVKLRPLEAMPATVTTTFPVVAPAGTDILMVVSLQAVATAGVPLNATVLPPCVAPNLNPVIITGVPTTPKVGLILPMTGLVTVKLTPLDCTPCTVTLTFPVTAPIGTETLMLVLLQLVTLALISRPPEALVKFTELPPCADPKFVPVIVTGVPDGPLATLRLEMAGGTVKATLLEGTPETVTTIFPVVAPIGTEVLMLVAVHPVTTAAPPLKVTVLPPCEDPKLDPVIVTGVPSGPLFTLRLEMAGDVDATPPDEAKAIKPATASAVVLAIVHVADTAPPALCLKSAAASPKIDMESRATNGLATAGVPPCASASTA